MISNVLHYGILLYLTFATENGDVNSFLLDAPSCECFKLRDLGDLFDLVRLVGTAAKKGSVVWHKNVGQAQFVLGRYLMNLHDREWKHSHVQKAAEALVADGRGFQPQLMDDVNVRKDIN